MFFDGSHTHNVFGFGILFVTLHGYTIPKSFKLLFPCTNTYLLYAKFIMASSSSALAMQPVQHKYQGKPKKLRFFDAYFEVRDIEMGHIDWNFFLL